MKGGSSLIFLVVLVIVFYFLLILPQRRNQKKKADMMKQLSPGAKVMTASGIYAEVVEIHDDIVIAQIAEGVEIEMDQRAVVRVVSEGPAFSDEADDELLENEDGHPLGAPEYEEEDDEDEATREFDSHVEDHGEQNRRS